MSVLGAAAIGAGGSLIGGAIDNRAAKKARKQEIALQKEFAQNQIQWKVQDAKKAGLHPLFALGGGAGVSPQITTGQSGMGSAVRDAVDTVARAQEAQAMTPEREAALRSVNASADRDEAEAALHRSRIALEMFNSMFSGGSMTNRMVEAAARGAGSSGKKVVKTPVEIPHAKGDAPGTVAGETPLFKDYVVGRKADGTPNTMRLVAGDEPSEALEMGPAILALLKYFGLFDDKPVRERQRKGRNRRRSGGGGW